MPPKKVQKYRGPSRPLDPRYAPGPGAKQNRDTFGMWLIGISVVVVFSIILWVALLKGGAATTTTTTTTGATANTTSVDMSAQATQQVIAQNTQIVIDSTETADLPRIEPKDALGLYNAGSVTIIDVRGRDAYLQGHIKNATNIPESEVSKRLAEFPKLGNLLVYCQ